MKRLFYTMGDKIFFDYKAFVEVAQDRLIELGEVYKTFDVIPNPNTCFIEV